MQSPAALAVRVACAADAASNACAAMGWSADDSEALLADAESLADTWRHLGAEEMREQVEAHLESNWPDASEALRDQIVSRVCAA